MCRLSKSSDEFDACKKNKDGRDSRCKQCRKGAYLADREARIKQARDLYQKNRSARLSQKADRYREHRNDITLHRREAWKSNPRIRETRNKYHDERRRLCYEKLGNKCLCGNTDPQLLCVDHVRDDGQGERANGLSHIKLWNTIIRNGPEGRYQLLCFNCNLKKSICKTFSPILTGETKLCPTCRAEHDTAYFRKDGDQLCYECRTCSASRDRIVKQIAFAKLGGAKCRACGTEDIDVLTLDHINNDGGGRRREASGVAIYRSVIYSSPTRSDLQVLCLNCNIKKHLNGVVATTIPIPASSIPTKTVEFDFSDVSISRVSDRRAVEFLELHHYIGYGRRATALYAMTLGKTIIAVTKFAFPIRKEVTSSMKIEHGKCLELDRLCIHPSYHKKNFASWMLARIARLVKTDFPEITTLVSFADPEAGHDGTIYKAANWTELGKTSRSFVYVDANGDKIHKKTVYNAAKVRGLKELEHASMLGLRRSYTVPKIKFVYDLR